MDNNLLAKYAKLTVCKGANVQKGQYVVIKAPYFAAEFARMCALEAYKREASYVECNFFDEQLTRLHYKYANEDELKNLPQWQYDKSKYAIDKGCCYIYITSPIPDVFNDVDAKLLADVNLAVNQKMKPLQYYTTNSVGQWTIVAYPNVKWAKKLFSDLDEDEANNKLMEAILQAVRVDEDNDPNILWDKHDKDLLDHCRKLNEYNFESLHFVNDLGTDLYVGLVRDHIWAGGMEVTTDGRKISFNPNMPTEEVFTMPDRNRVNGKVVATKPLCHNGKVFTDFSFVFKDGLIVDFDAKTEKEYLRQVLDMDEGTRHIGEVALISYDSPISNQNILYYNTLFDENASCHLALGACYPTNIKNGDAMDDEQLLANGGNISINHIDFMFGSKDMNVYGKTYSGEEIQIFKCGNFCI